VRVLSTVIMESATTKLTTEGNNLHYSPLGQGPVINVEH
jgi:hypothetical protein